MPESVIGTCGICGGRVVEWIGGWLGMQRPVTHCKKCGAVPKGTNPVIPMEPKRQSPINGYGLSIPPLVD